MGGANDSTIPRSSEVASSAISPSQEAKYKVLSEITCTALVSIEKNFENKKELEKIILIKIPTEVYPTLYETFIYLFKQAGVKDLNIEKRVDFEKLYNERLAN